MKTILKVLSSKSKRKIPYSSPHNPPPNLHANNLLKHLKVLAVKSIQYLIIYRMQLITFSLLGGEEYGLEYTSNLSIPEELCQNNYSLCY